MKRLLECLLSGAIATTPFWAAACAPATPAAPAAPKVVDIKASDGLTLKGTLFSAASPGPAVLLLHQCDEQRKVWDSLGTRLAAAGVTALSVDYRGYGESGGTPHDKLSNAELTAQQTSVWPTDIDSAFAFLTRQPGVKIERLGAAGGSCGVGNAVGLARRHGNVKALALLAGPLDRDGRLFLERPGAPPVFAAAAGDDQYANFVLVMSWLYGVSPRPESRLAQYPTGGHAAVMFRTHPGLADTIAKWFAGVLPETAGPLPATNGVPLAPAILGALHDVDAPGGAAAALKRLANAPPSEPRLPEYIVNQLGYEHMLMKDYPAAIDLMTLNTRLYPDSPNTQDSLGDVYLAAGDKKAALATAKKTLELLPKDTVDTPQRKSDLRGAAEGKIKQLSSR
jgi:dienelactone hydrolase